MAAGIGISGFGVVLNYAGATNATNATNTVTNLKDITPPSQVSGDIEITHHTSPNGVKEFIAGLRDGGDMTFSASFVLSEYTTLHNYWKLGLKLPWKITAPTATTHTVSFNGHLKALASKMPIDGEPLMYEATVKVGSDVTLA